MPQPQPPDTSVLVHRLLAAPAAEQGRVWSELIAACRPLLRQVFSAFLQSRPSDYQYEDLEEDLYCHLSPSNWRRLRQYRPQPGTTFPTWMAAVARNLLRDKHRRHSPPTVSIHDRPGEECDPFEETLPDPGPTPEELCMLMELRRIILEAIARLRDPDCPEIILRHVLCDHPQQFDQIAAKMGLKPATVRQKYRRNLKALKEELPPAVLGKP